MVFVPVSRSDVSDFDSIILDELLSIGIMPDTAISPLGFKIK